MAAEDKEPEVEETEEIDPVTGAVIKRRIVRKVQRSVVTTKTTEPQTFTMTAEDKEPEVEETEEVDPVTGAIVKRRIVRTVQKSVVTTKTTEPQTFTMTAEDKEPEVEETEEVDPVTGAIVKRRIVRTVQKSVVTTKTTEPQTSTMTAEDKEPEVEETEEVDPVTGATIKRRIVRTVQKSVVSTKTTEPQTFTMTAEDKEPEVEETEEVDPVTGATIKRRIVRTVQKSVVTTKTTEPQTSTMTAEDKEPEVEETEEVDPLTGAIIKRRIIRTVKKSVVTTKPSEQLTSVIDHEDEPEVEETEEVDPVTGAFIKRRVVRKVQRSVVTTKATELQTATKQEDEPEVEEREEVDPTTGAIIKLRTVRKVERTFLSSEPPTEVSRDDTSLVVGPEEVEETEEVDEETGAVIKRRTVKKVQTSIVTKIEDSKKSEKKSVEFFSDKPESDQYLLHSSTSSLPSMSSLPSKFKKEVDDVRDGCASASGSLVSEISRKGSNSTISEISETSFQISTGLIDQVFPTVETEFNISFKDFDLGLSSSSSVRKDSSSSTISQASESIRKISSEGESRKVSSTSVRSRKTSGESVTFSRDRSSPLPSDDPVRSSPRREHSSPMIESRRKLSSLSEDGSIVSETSEIIGGRRVVRRTIVTQVIQTYEDDDEDGEWKLVSEEAKVETFPGDLPEGSVKRTSFSSVPESILPASVLDRPSFITDARAFDQPDPDAAYSATESEHSSLNYQDEPGISARSHYAYSEHLYSGTESEQSSLQYVSEQIEPSEAQTAMHIDLQNGNDNDDINSNSSGGGLTPGHVDDNRQRTLSVSSQRSDASPQATSSPSRSGVEFDPVAAWGKPLGLPTPLPPEDNLNSSKKVNSPLPNSPAKMTRKSATPKRSPPPIYVDLAYVPHHGNPDYCDVEYFKRIRARNYVFSGVEPSMKVFNALLEAKMQWEGDDKNLDVTIIPTYDSDSLGTWVANHEDILARNRIDLAPSASRCTINLQDYDSACSAYRLEF